MDGARLMNAVSLLVWCSKDMVASYDSVWLDFTKGLGAPLGAALCGRMSLSAPGGGSSAWWFHAPGRHLRRCLHLCAGRY
jgi:hypothetical protein